MFDPQNSGLFELRHLEEVLAMFELFPPTHLSRLVFREFDRNLDGKVSLKEFKNAISPYDKNYAQLLEGKKAFNSKFNFQRLAIFTPAT